MTAATTGGRMRLYASRDYRLWWFGAVISAIGSRVAGVALPIVVLMLTKSASQASIVAALGVVPFIVLGLPVGILVDRSKRKLLLGAASLVSMLAIGAIAAAYLLGSLTMGVIYAAALVCGSAAVVFGVAEVAVLPCLVPKELFGAASGQAEMIWGISAILGPPVAGLLYQLSVAAPFAADAVSFGLVGLCVLAIRTPLGAKPPFPPIKWRRDLGSGLRELRTWHRLRAITWLTLAGDVLFSGIPLVMIVLVQSSAGSPATIGLVFSAAAAGGIIGSVTANRIEQRIGLRAAVIAKHWLTAAVFPLLAIGLDPAVIAIVWAFVNFLVSILNVIQMQYLLSVIPADVLGRVQSFTAFLINGCAPIGIAVTGYVLDRLDGARTVLVFSVLLVLFSVYATFSRDLRTADRPGAEPAEHQPSEARE